MRFYHFVTVGAMSTIPRCSHHDLLRDMPRNTIVDLAYASYRYSSNYVCYLHYGQWVHYHIELKINI